MKAIFNYYILVSIREVVHRIMGRDRFFTVYLVIIIMVLFIIIIVVIVIVTGQIVKELYLFVVYQFRDK